MDLCLASHRAAFKALQAHEDGELALTARGAVTIATAAGDLRFIDGACFAAPSPAWIGAELIGWLEELHALSGVGAWWRPGLRPVLRTRQGSVAVALASQDLSIDGKPAAAGIATHSARFIVAHGDSTEAAAAPSRPAPAPAVSVSRAPAPPPPPVRVRRPALPLALPPDSDSTLRERGTWRSTAVEPWNLGQGRPVTRGPREPYGPLPAVVPPPRPPMYTPTRASVHTPPGPLCRVA